MIDTLHEPNIGKRKKVRTYRWIERKEYLKVAKKRKPSRQQIRNGIRKQLQYIVRNLRYIGQLGKETPLTRLSGKQYRDLLVIGELYRQQRKMYENKSHKAEGRIVSIAQPHVRPIVRGKVSADVESGDLKQQIENYKIRFGYYPESVHVDQIYRNRENRNYCKGRNIRISGPPLGRPPKDPVDRKRLAKEAYEDEKLRIPVEGKIGNGKRKYGLDRIKTKMKNTSETVIGVTILVMNLEKILKDFLLSKIFQIVEVVKSFIKRLIRVFKWMNMPVVSR